MPGDTSHQLDKGTQGDKGRNVGENGSQRGCAETCVVQAQQDMMWDRETRKVGDSWGSPAHKGLPKRKTGIKMVP